MGDAQMRRGLKEFGRAASAAEVAVVFYAGHGIEVDGRNYLVPVDARLASDQDVEYEVVPLELTQRAVDRASGLRLVILDACRDNPFAKSMQRAGATRSIGRGLARVEPSGQTLIAYAAKEGTVASDGEGRNSPYSEALVRYLEEPGLEVMFMFRKVRDAVLTATGGRQTPFVYGSLSSKGAYLAAEPVAGPTPSQRLSTADESGSHRVAAERLAAERLFWESVKDSEEPADISAYLAQYPGGTYAALAHNRLKRLAPSPLPDDESVSTGREDMLHLLAKKTWKTETRRWDIELRIEGGRVVAIVNVKGGGSMRCTGDVDSVGKIKAWCMGSTFGHRRLEGTFPNLELRNTSGAALGGASFVFELENES